VEGSYYYQTEVLSLLAKMRSLFPLLFITLYFFEHLKSSQVVLSHQAASVDVVSSFVYAVRSLVSSSGENETDILSDDQWNMILFSLPNYLRVVIHRALLQAKSDASPSWPLPVLKWMNRNDLCGKCASSYIYFCLIVFVISLSKSESLL
jgi:hypothetical protein